MADEKKFLDAGGLEHAWDKIKTWLGSWKTNQFGNMSVVNNRQNYTPVEVEFGDDFTFYRSDMISSSESLEINTLFGFAVIGKADTNIGLITRANNKTNRSLKFIVTCYGSGEGNADVSRLDSVTVAPGSTESLKNYMNLVTVAVLFWYPI